MPRCKCRGVCGVENRGEGKYSGEGEREGSCLVPFARVKVSSKLATEDWPGGSAHCSTRYAKQRRASTTTRSNCDMAACHDCEPPPGVLQRSVAVYSPRSSNACVKTPPAPDVDTSERRPLGWCTTERAQLLLVVVIVFAAKVTASPTSIALEAKPD